MKQIRTGAQLGKEGRIHPLPSKRKMSLNRLFAPLMTNLYREGGRAQLPHHRHNQFNTLKELI